MNHSANIANQHQVHWHQWTTLITEFLSVSSAIMGTTYRDWVHWSVLMETGRHPCYLNACLPRVSFLKWCMPLIKEAIERGWQSPMDLMWWCHVRMEEPAQFHQFRWTVLSVHWRHKRLVAVFLRQESRAMMKLLWRIYYLMKETSRIQLKKMIADRRIRIRKCWFTKMKILVKLKTLSHLELKFHLIVSQAWLAKELRGKLSVKTEAGSAEHMTAVFKDKLWFCNTRKFIFW